MNDDAFLWGVVGEEMLLDGIFNEHSDSDASLDSDSSLGERERERDRERERERKSYEWFDHDGCLKTPDRAMSVVLRTAAGVPLMDEATDVADSITFIFEDIHLGVSSYRHFVHSALNNFMLNFDLSHLLRIEFTHVGGPPLQLTVINDLLSLFFHIGFALRSVRVSVSASEILARDRDCLTFESLLAGSLFPEFEHFSWDADLTAGLLHDSALNGLLRVISKKARGVVLISSQNFFEFADTASTKCLCASNDASYMDIRCGSSVGLGNFIMGAVGAQSGSCKRLCLWRLGQPVWQHDAPMFEFLLQTCTIFSTVTIGTQDRYGGMIPSHILLRLWRGAFAGRVSDVHLLVDAFHFTFLDYRRAEDLASTLLPRNYHLVQFSGSNNSPEYDSTPSSSLYIALNRAKRHSLRPFVGGSCPFLRWFGVLLSVAGDGLIDLSCVFYMVRFDPTKLSARGNCL